jgi:hypothetical protein
MGRMENTKMNSRKQRIVELGELGEEILLIYLSGKTNDIKLSTDPYDSSRDILFRDKSIEVKTQVRNLTGNLLTTERRQTNLKKCMTVDMLIFVEFDQTKYISIWSPIDREHYTDYTLDCGTRMRGWYINKNEIGPGCHLLAKLECPQLASRMRALSPSKTYLSETEKSHYSIRPTSL